MANSSWKWGVRNTVMEDQLHLEAVKRCIKSYCSFITRVLLIVDLKLLCSITFYFTSSKTLYSLGGHLLSYLFQKQVIKHIQQQAVNTLKTGPSYRKHVISRQRWVNGTSWILNMSFPQLKQLPCLKTRINNHINFNYHYKCLYLLLQNNWHLISILRATCI